MNTWRRQPRTAKNDHADISARMLPTGTVKRRIDYIMDNQKFRNCVRQTHVIHEWRGNPDRERQHSAVRLEICIRLKRLLRKAITQHRPGCRVWLKTSSRTTTIACATFPDKPNPTKNINQNRVPTETGKTHEKYCMTH